jgi:uncharacterized protein YprB with RNaseH-like and TPR domain
LLGGVWEETAHGPALYLEKSYELAEEHGDFGLGEILEVSDGALAQLGCAGRPQDLLFLDVETTGLNGGTGTLAFLIGAARIVGERVVLRQYFLARPHFEPAMLAGLTAFASGVEQIVTYNGSSFDMPLLQSRYTMSRQRGSIVELPQLDLLHPARRFYSRSLESCRLKDLEERVLGVERGSDIPGWAVPQVYFGFVREGTVGLMPAVVRHNALDVLSLMTLLRKIGGLVGGERFVLPSEAIELARLAYVQGKVEESLAFHQAALSLAGAPRLRAYALSRHLQVLKRSKRWLEVRDLCLEEIRLGLASPAVYVEAAKACEHHTGDLRLAVRLIEQALLRTRLRSHHDALLADLEHRRRRLLRKLARRTGKKKRPPLGGPLSFRK